MSSSYSVIGNQGNPKPLEDHALVSVIMPCYNHGRYIWEAIESVQAQSWRNWELLIIDNFSEDDTAAVVERYLGDTRLRLHYFRNNGIIAASRNFGLGRAQGEYIGFIDSDDTWEPDKLEMQVHFLEQHPQVDLVCANAQYFPARMSFSPTVVRRHAGTIDFRELACRNHIVNSSVLLRAQAVREVGLLSEDPALRASEDYHYWLRIAARRARSLYFDSHVLVGYRVHESNNLMSSSDGDPSTPFRRQWRRVYRILLPYRSVLGKRNYRRALRCWVIYTRQAILEFSLRSRNISYKAALRWTYLPAHLRAAIVLKSVLLRMSNTISSAKNRPAVRQDVASVNEPNKRIAFFVPQFIAGGVQRTTLTLAHGLGTNGWTIDLLVIEDSHFIKEVPSEVRVVRLSAASLASSVGAVARYLRVNRPRFLISSMPQVNIVSVVARILSRVDTTRLILTEVSHFSSWQRFFPSVKMSLIRRLMQLTYPKSDGVVCVTQSIAEDLRSFIPLHEDRLHVVPSPIDLAIIHKRSGISCSLPWPIGSGIDVVTTLSRLDPVKDISTLVRAVQIAARTRPSIRLLVIGDGVERTSLEQLSRDLHLENVIHFTGYVDEPYALLAQSRVFVLSSKIEGFPTVLVEALALGIPVVATDCLTGPREILKDGQFGKLVAVGDSAALADALLSTLADPNGSATAVLRSRAAEYDYRTTVANYESIFAELG